MKLFDYPRRWYSTDLVNYPDSLTSEILDPLDPSVDAVAASRGRIQQTRNEIEAGFFDVLAGIDKDENRERVDISIQGLDLAFLDQRQSDWDDPLEHA
jgi:hypothetical protein